MHCIVIFPLATSVWGDSLKSCKYTAHQNVHSKISSHCLFLLKPIFIMVVTNWWLSNSGTPSTYSLLPVYWSLHTPSMKLVFFLMIYNVFFPNLTLGSPFWLPLVPFWHIPITFTTSLLVLTNYSRLILTYLPCCSPEINYLTKVLWFFFVGSGCYVSLLLQGCLLNPFSNRAGKGQPTHTHNHVPIPMSLVPSSPGPSLFFPTLCFCVIFFLQLESWLLT